MRKIIIKLAVLLMTLLIIDRVFTYFFLKNIFSKTISGESGGSVNYLLQKKKNTDFIILGSSRAKHHINPALLTNVYAGNGYNAGINGTGGLIYNSMLLNLLINKGFIPKLVILQTDAYPYFITEEESITPELSPLYPFINQSKVFDDFIKENTGYAEKIKLLLHTYRFNGKLLNVWYNYTKRRSVNDNNGFEGLNGKMDTTGFHITADINRKHRFSQIKMNALTNIAQTCKANNIKLVVVLPPSYKNSILYKQGNNTIIEFLHTNGVTYIYDLSDIEKIPALQSKDVWRDATHMNNNGATLFSKMLNDSLAHFH